MLGLHSALDVSEQTEAEADKTNFLLIGHEQQRNKYLAMFPVDLLDVKSRPANAALLKFGGHFQHELQFPFPCVGCL